MRFLAKSETLAQEHLDLLWDGSKSTDREYVRAVYDTIIEVSSDISIEVS